MEIKIRGNTRGEKNSTSLTTIFFQPDGENYLINQNQIYFA